MWCFSKLPRLVLMPSSSEIEVLSQFLESIRHTGYIPTMYVFRWFEHMTYFHILSKVQQCQPDSWVTHMTCVWETRTKTNKQKKLFCALVWAIKLNSEVNCTIVQHLFLHFPTNSVRAVTKKEKKNDSNTAVAWADPEPQGPAQSNIPFCERKKKKSQFLIHFNETSALAL